MRYIGKTAWPLNLAAFYPYPVRGIPLWEVVASVIVLAGVAALAIAMRRGRPWLAAGWCWYLLTLLPVIGIVQAGMQAMADRYMYMPMIGLLIAMAWELGELWDRSQREARVVMTAAGGCAMIACAVLSWRQTHVWKDGLTLFTHALQVTENNFVAHDNVGVELDRRGQFDEALAHYRETLRIKPGDRHGEENYAQASFAKGERLFTQGRPDEALETFREGLRYRPRNAMAHTYVGIILTQRNELAAAMAEFGAAIAIDATLVRAYLGLGVALAQAGKTAEAERAFADGVRYGSTSVEAHYDRALAQMALGRNAEALESCDAALRLQPDFGPAHAARAEALYALGSYEDAWRAVLAAKAAKAQVDPAIEARLAAKFRR
jgi:tetratricopeptide (TPR) repeat protein